jgi:hypothetical protein
LHIQNNQQLHAKNSRFLLYFVVKMWMMTHSFFALPFCFVEINDDIEITDQLINYSSKVKLTRDAVIVCFA